MSVTEHPNHRVFDDMSTEDLEGILRMDSYGAENDEYDTDAILYIMEVVAKRKRQSGSAEAQALVSQKLKEFKEEYLPGNDRTSLYQFDDELDTAEQPKTSPSRRRKPTRCIMRRVGLVAAVVVVIFGLMITAQAAGLDIFGAIARWTDETFHFSVSGEAEIADWAKPFQDKLSEIGLEGTFFSHPFPQGIFPGELQVFVYDTYSRVSLPLSTLDNQYIDVLISVYSDPSAMESISFEKDQSFVEEYTDGERHIYIFENLGNTNIVCQTDDIIYSVIGYEDVSQDTLLQVLDSVEVTL